MKRGSPFCPTEIIFSVTDSCNLKCAHCRSYGGASFLNAEKAVQFLEMCSGATIDTIGFTGGEPFLAMDFIEKVAKYAVGKDFLFDRIITNGVWWKNEDELCDRLRRLYESGFDGKIAVSFDSFHNQSVEKITAFCKVASSIFKSDRMIEMQSVVKQCKGERNGAKDALEIAFLEKLHALATNLNCSFDAFLSKKTGTGTISLKSISLKSLEEENFFITADRTPQAFECTNPNGWNARHWFSDDFCKSLGNILFVHPDGKIAPCCGFSNDESSLIIGSIEDSFEQIMENARNNKMVKICFETGLLSEAKKLRKKIALPGKTEHPCTLCQFLCKNFVNI